MIHPASHTAKRARSHDPISHYAQCYDNLVTNKASRRGTWGSLLLGIPHFLLPESWGKAHAQINAAVVAGMLPPRCARVRPIEAVDRACLSEEQIHQLALAAVEEVAATHLGLESVYRHVFYSSPTAAQTQTSSHVLGKMLTTKTLDSFRLYNASRLHMMALATTQTSQTRQWWLGSGLSWCHD